jgi:acyl-coenzyme A thioesterase PaaI-like protein
MNRFHPNADCFCCGRENPANLGLRVVAHGPESVGVAQLDERHQGTAGIAHGGVIAVLMDEMLGSVLQTVGAPSVTASLTVDYRAPVALPAEVRMRAWCAEAAGRKRALRGQAWSGDALVAEAHGWWLLVDEGFYARIGVEAPPALAGLDPEGALGRTCPDLDASAPPPHVDAVE